jgi:hypothetical protein
LADRLRRWTTEMPSGVRWPLLACGLGLFVGVVFVRGGPPPTSVDTYSVVRPTTALSEGHLAEAARESVYPQPPGYPLLASPFVVALRPLVGSDTWCSDKPLPAFVQDLQHPCTEARGRSHTPNPPPWYRSQAVLGVLAWMGLAGGCVWLLRSAGAGGGFVEIAVVWLVAALPPASNAMVETFHPQDLLCVGAIAAGLGETLRRRWVVAGLCFGVAFLCKQFALMPLVAVLVVAPGWRTRFRIALPAAVVVVAGVLPFLVGDASRTVKDLTDSIVAGQGLELTPTVVGMGQISDSAKLAISRDGPLVLSMVLALAARFWAKDRLLAPGPLLGLAVACLATRLVFEVNLTSYYLLAVATTLIVLDLARRRLPVRSLLWVGASSAWVAGVGASSSMGGQAAIYLAFSLAAVVIGLWETTPWALPGRSRDRPSEVRFRQS